MPPDRAHLTPLAIRRLSVSFLLIGMALGGFLIVGEPIWLGFLVGGLLALGYCAVDGIARSQGASAGGRNFKPSVQDGRFEAQNGAP